MAAQKPEMMMMMMMMMILLYLFRELLQWEIIIIWV